jgi:para-aminobenzoate synthetase component 1
MEEETDANFHKFNIQFQSRTSKENYIQNVIKLKEYIQRGDIYEVNYCQEFYAENVEINYPLDTYFKLNNISKAPFSGFLQIGDYLVFCGSPERYIQKKDNKLISQPIKGTAARNEDEAIDNLNKSERFRLPVENNNFEQVKKILLQ